MNYDHETLAIYDLSFPSALPKIGAQVTNSLRVDSAQDRRVEANQFGCRFVDRSRGEEIERTVRHFGLRDFIISPGWTMVATLGFPEYDTSLPYRKEYRLWKFPSGERIPLPEGFVDAESSGKLLFLDEETLLGSRDGKVTVASLAGDRSRTFEYPVESSDSEPRTTEFVPAPGANRVFCIRGRKVFEVDPWGEPALRLLAELRQPVTHAYPSDDGSILVLAQEDDLLRVLHTATAEHATSMRADHLSFESFVGNKHALLHSAQGLQLYELATLRPVMAPIAAREEQAVAFQPGRLWGANDRDLADDSPSPGTLSLSRSSALPTEYKQTMQLWTIPGGHPLTPQMQAFHPPVMTRQGRILAVGKGDLDSNSRNLWTRFAQWELPLIESALPGEFLELAELLADKRLSSFGVLERIGPGAILKASTNSGGSSTITDPELARISAWLSKAPTKRSVSPYFDRDRGSYLDLLIQNGSDYDFQLANSLNASLTSLQMAHLARQHCINGSRERGEELIARALQLAPVDADVKRIAGEIHQMVDPNRTRFPKPDEINFKP